MLSFPVIPISLSNVRPRTVRLPGMVWLSVAEPEVEPELPIVTNLSTRALRLAYLFCKLLRISDVFCPVTSGTWFCGWPDIVGVGADCTPTTSG